MIIQIVIHSKSSETRGPIEESSLLLVMDMLTVNLLSDLLAIKWADPSPPRFCSRSTRIGANFQPAADSPRVRGRSATSTAVNFFSKKKF